MVRDKVPFSEAARQVVGAVPSGQSSYAAVAASGVTTSAVQTASARVVSQSRGSQAAPVRSVATQTDVDVVSVGTQTEIDLQDKVSVNHMVQTVTSCHEFWRPSCQRFQTRFKEIDFEKDQDGDIFNYTNESFDEEDPFYNDRLLWSYTVSASESDGDADIEDVEEDITDSNVIKQCDKVSLPDDDTIKDDMDASVGRPMEPTDSNTFQKYDKMSLQDLSRLDRRVDPGDRVLIGRASKDELSSQSRILIGRVNADVCKSDRVEVAGCSQQNRCDRSPIRFPR
jgi:hypothetical protein